MTESVAEDYIRDFHKIQYVCMKLGIHFTASEKVSNWVLWNPDVLRNDV